jgi:hypothetical protein
VQTTIAISVITLDTLRVQFAIPVSVDRASVISNYALSVVTAGAGSISLKSIRSYTENRSIEYIDLEITRPSLEATYKLSITGLADVNGATITETIGYFVSKPTKVDSMIRSINRMYDTSLSSNIRGILTAVGLEDEILGGKGSLSIRPVL